MKLIKGSYRLQFENTVVERWLDPATGKVYLIPNPTASTHAILQMHLIGGVWRTHDAKYTFLAYT